MGFEPIMGAGYSSFEDIPVPQMADGMHVQQGDSTLWNIALVAGIMLFVAATGLFILSFRKNTALTKG